MKQPTWAPVALGSGLASGVAAMIVGGYKITDCFAYRNAMGFCDEVVEENIMSVVGGIGALAGSVGGFFMYNFRLERPEFIPRLQENGLAVEFDSEPESPDPNKVTEVPIEILVHEAYQLTRSEQKTADELGISRYQVRKILNRI